MINHLVTSSLCFLLALTVSFVGYSISLPDLTDDARAGDAIGIAPGLNNTTPASDIIPGESLRTIPDIPDNDGGKPADLPGNQGISDLVMGIAPGQAGTTPGPFDPVPGELISALKTDSSETNADPVAETLLSAPLTIPMGGAIAIPEPTMLVMIVAGFLGIFRRR